MVKAKTKPKGATSYKETAFGIISHQEIVELELEGIKRGLEYIQSLFEKKKTLKITPDIICKLHEISFGWIFPKWAGKYRKIQVTFSEKEAPPYYQVPELVKNFCDDLGERIRHLSKPDEKLFVIQVVELLAWFQHRFVFIHPFQDYNGRCARMLTTFILLSLDLPPIELKAEIGEDRSKYLKAMQKGDDGDLAFLEILINKSLFESLEKINK